jgi:hypothetical protein
MVSLLASTDISAGHGLDRSNSPGPVGAAAGLPTDRRGRLDSGNRSGDFLAAPRCGAKTRVGGCCRQPAMRNGRCRLHGGLSTGPRTPEGLARSRRARFIHGGRSARVRALLREARLRARRTRGLRARLTGSSAGHGVHRAKSPFTVGAACPRVKPGDRPPSSTTAPSSTASRRNGPRARAARPYTERSNRISAWHGVHRSNSQPQPAAPAIPPRPPAFIRAHLRP